MRNLRLVARLDIKNDTLIKGVHLEGLRVLGSPNSFAIDYYLQGADELLYMDCVASLYGRNHLASIIQETAKNVFIPITVGGGIRSVKDAEEILRSGADKIAINTAAVSNPKLISDIANRFGSQCVVLSVEAKQIGGGWEVFTENGREKTGLDVIEWVQHAIQMGAGEVLLTSIDKEGTRKGFDIPLIKAVSSKISVPIIASGGMGKLEDIKYAVFDGGVDAVAMADILHYKRAKISDIRNYAKSVKIKVRSHDFA